MMQSNLREHWQKMLDRDRQFLHEHLRKDPFDKWDRSRMPETRAEQYFINGIQMLMVEFSNLDAAKYLETCIAVGQRALAENRLQAKKCVESFPQNRGQLVRCMVYSEAILQNALDKERLLQASRDYESWCVETTKQNWDDQIQAYYLAGVRVALIGGDSTRAASLLGRAKHFKAHPDQSRILKQLASGTLDASFEASMGTYFDFVRNPFTEKKVFLEPNVQAFELAILREVFIANPGKPINWSSVLDSLVR